jgi:heme-degrading monooxygenase HmoA
MQPVTANIRSRTTVKFVNFAREEILLHRWRANRHSRRKALIGRIWRTGIKSGQAEAYEAFARTVSLPMFRAQRGFAGVLMAREGNRAWVLTLWRDQAAIDALASSESYAATVDRILASGFLDGEQSTEVAELHLLEIPDVKPD